MRELVLSFIAVLSCHSLLAQTPGIEPGTPLRISARGFTAAGEMVRWNADSLVLRLEDGSSPNRQAIALGEIVAVEAQVSRSRGRGAARGAFWGGVIGGAIGGVLGLVAAADQQSGDGEGLLIGGAVVGGLGAGIGALVGVLVPVEKWSPVPTDSQGAPAR
jgi:hypothetical protein